MRKSVIGLLAVVMVLCWSNLALAVEVGQKAPDFELPDVRNAENKVKLSGLQGKYVLIDFWATWCGPCRATMAETLKPLWDKIGDKKDKWTMISVGCGGEAWSDTADKQKAYADEQDYKWTFVHDGDGKVADTYGVEGIPTLVLVGPDGKIVSMEHEAPLLVYDLVAERKPVHERAADLPGETVKVELDGFADDRVYRLSGGENGGTFVVETSSDDETADTVLGVYNAEGEIVDSNDDIDDETLTSRVTIKVEAGQTVFVRAMGYGGSAPTFTLTVTRKGD